jgi:hypothetical protein
MATRDDVRRIAGALPGAVSDPATGAYRVGGKLFAWPWLERIDPKRARVPNHDVLVVRVGTEEDKRVLVEGGTRIFFTEPHYDGYAAVLIRLAEIDVELLREMLTRAWRIRAPRRLQEQHGAHGLEASDDR